MNVAFERTGGFAGVRQRLEISSDSGKVKVEDRHTGTRERALAEGEAARLGALVEKARAVPFAASEGGGMRDGFTIRLWLDGEEKPRATMSTMAMPLEESDGTPWGDLFSFVDGILTAELEK